ncbi:hypothetical protein EJ110_NYTH46074 [Nymphaea thermarum]|nr:hypothetical protein EJ110_NYTH46074 [Nymphaea thermarum]
MAAIKPVVVFAALAFLVFHLVEGRLASELQLAEVRGPERSLLQTIDCAVACSRGVQRHRGRKGASSSAGAAGRDATASLPAPTATRRPALAMLASPPTVESPNAPEDLNTLRDVTYGIVICIFFPRLVCSSMFLMIYSKIMY